MTEGESKARKGLQPLGSAALPLQPSPPGQNPVPSTPLSTSYCRYSGSSYVLGAHSVCLFVTYCFPFSAPALGSNTW